MTIDAPALLEGPRGRRLCLEVALAADASGALFASCVDAERAFHPIDGSVATLWLGDSPDQPLPDPVSPPEVADGLRMIDAGALAAAVRSNEALLRCLTSTVDAARYWQAPESRDQLASVDVVARALVPVAEALADAGVLVRWSQPIAGEQWRVEFETRESDVSWPGDVRRALAVWRSQTLRREVLHAGVHVEPGVHITGAWWSRPVELPSTAGAVADVPAGLGLVEDGAGWQLALVTPARGSGRVLELDATVWADLCRRHPLEVTATSGADWARATGRAGRWVVPDWSAVAAEWDAVHLTIAQYLALAGRILDVSDGVASLVAGWSPDCTVWLTDAVRLWGEPQPWALEQLDSGLVRWRPEEQPAN